MGQEEQDQIIGRLFRESNEAKRSLGLLNEKLRNLRDGLKNFQIDLETARSSSIEQNHGSLREFINIEAFKDLLEKREDASRKVEEFARRVRDLGND